MPPRPQAPDKLYADFQRHLETCGVCRADARQVCPYGEHLLEAWGDADRFYAEEQRVIEAATDGAAS